MSGVVTALVPRFATLFTSSMGSHFDSGFATTNGNRYHALVTADNTDGRGALTFYVPSDFISFTSLEFLWKTPAASGLFLYFSAYVHWAADGEVASTSAETLGAGQLTSGGAEFMNLDEHGTASLSGIAKGDWVGIEFRFLRSHASDTLSNTAEFLGVNFNYVASQ